MLVIWSLTLFDRCIQYLRPSTHNKKHNAHPTNTHQLINDQHLLEGTEHSRGSHSEEENAGSETSSDDHREDPSSKHLNEQLPVDASLALEETDTDGGTDLADEIPPAQR